MQYHDNHNKFILLVNSKIPAGKQMNAIAHLSYGMSHRGLDVLQVPIDHYIGNDGSSHSTISRYPFIILKAKNSSQISTFRDRCIEENLPYNDFVEQMIAGSSEEQLARTQETPVDELEYIALCVYGAAEKLAPITKKFSLFK